MRPVDLAELGRLASVAKGSNPALSASLDWVGPSGLNR